LVVREEHLDFFQEHLEKNGAGRKPCFKTSLLQKKKRAGRQALL
jgi:hypothetical protein